MNIEDIDKIMGITPFLGDGLIPSDGKTFSMRRKPQRDETIEPKTEADAWYADAMEFLEKGNEVVGLYLLEEAYKMGSDEAGNQLALGKTYGWFGERDFKGAADIFRALAKKGNPNAMNNYAIALYQGLGVRQDLRWAEYWLKKAISKGNLCAAAMYGQLIVNGDLPAHSAEEGVALLFWAADYGASGAMNDLGLCYEEGTGIGRDGKKAFDWFMKAVKYGDGACAEFNISRCYRYGIGVEADDDTAEAWEHLAVEHGFDIETYNWRYDL